MIWKYITVDENVCQANDEELNQFYKIHICTNHLYLSAVVWWIVYNYYVQFSPHIKFSEGLWWFWGFNIKVRAHSNCVEILMLNNKRWTKAAMNFSGFVQDLGKWRVSNTIKMLGNWNHFTLFQIIRGMQFHISSACNTQTSVVVCPTSRKFIRTDIARIIDGVQ